LLPLGTARGTLAVRTAEMPRPMGVIEKTAFSRHLGRRVPFASCRKQRVGMEEKRLGAKRARPSASSKKCGWTSNEPMRPAARCQFKTNGLCGGMIVEIRFMASACSTESSLLGSIRRK